MRAQLTRIATRRSGSVARRVETLEADPIRIGRAMGSEITLAGLAVSLHHADLVHRGDGVYAVPHPPAPLLRRGRSVAGEVRLREGDTLGIGPHELVVTALDADGFDICLEYRTVQGASEESPLDDASQLRIERGVLRRRVSVWAAVGAVVVGALLWPLLTARQSSWSTGRISNNHASIAVECGSCHRPFRPVQNDLCLECHGNLGSHVEVHPSFAGIDELRCASCHMEHGGAEGLAALNDALCASCHGNLSRRFAEADVHDASDFGGDHPEFTLHLLVPNPDGREDAPAVQRVTWSPEAEESSGLTFNHRAHVGGVRMPDGATSNLRCDACHDVDEGGRRMAPIRFEEHCQQCHTLNYSVGGDRSLGERKRQAQAPHGKPGELLREVRRTYLEEALPQQPGETPNERNRRLLRIRRPGAPRSPEEQRLVEEVNRRAEEAFAQLMSPESCGQCHTLVPEDSATPDDVAPVALTKAWLGATRFDHSSHASSPCATCHPRAAVHDSEYAARNEGFERDPATLEGRVPYGLVPLEQLRERGLEPSERASDVLVLGRESCRDCHAGSRAMAPAVASDCVMCHPYHRADYEPIALRVVKTPSQE